MVPAAIPAKLSRGAPDSPALGVRVRENGLLEVKVGEEWKETTLDGLKERIAGFAEEQDREMKKSGKSAYETLPGGVKVPGLFVSIDAEPSVPWQHVQWIMTVVAEQKFRRMELSDGTKRFLVTLPTDEFLKPAPKEPPLEIRISVHAVARREKPARWDDVQVLRPTEVRFRIGTEETAVIDGVRDYVKKAWDAVKDTPNATFSGEIKAGHKVPVEKVLDVLEVFASADLPAVCFYGREVPPAEVRAAERLPYPLKNYGH